MLAFFGAALVGLVVPSGCVMGPDGRRSDRGSLESILFAPERGCECGACETSCGAPCDEGACELGPAEGECAECPPRRKPWLHWPKLHLYEPEAGIFNFCIPPQCINPPSPLPPGRFFPVPVRPTFAPRAESNYGLLSSGGGRFSGDPSNADPPCPSALCP